MIRRTERVLTYYYRKAQGELLEASLYLAENYDILKPEAKQTATERITFFKQVCEGIKRHLEDVGSGLWHSQHYLRPSLRAKIIKKQLNKISFEISGAETGRLNPVGDDHDLRKAVFGYLFDKHHELTSGKKKQVKSRPARQLPARVGAMGAEM